ncbi:MAG: M3 family oligoendopeptidase [Anaerorhabdus sp.]
MKFEDFKYERPDFEDLSKKMNDILDKMEECSDPKKFIELFNSINKHRGDISTMNTLASIRHTIDTSDEFYDGEDQYWNKQGPLYEIIDQRLMRITVSKDFREELLKEIPETYFLLSEQRLKTFDEKIIPLLQEENQLSSDYAKLKASCKVEFDNEVLNLPLLSAKCEDVNRDTRKKATDAKVKWLSENEEKFDNIYDNLVKVRQKIAEALGFKNYIELGYLRMNRLDYNAEMVSNYRNQVKEYITPLAQSLFDKQKERLGTKELAYYDLPISFLSGNPTPKGKKDDQVRAAVKMYHEMSPETKEFIDVMDKQNLWDLESKTNKAGGGYCTFIYNYNVPFIFSNFNGTSGDVDVLTHEAGHAFQTYQSKWISVPDCTFPTYETCEIHSMSMEFFAWPWMEEFFKEDTNKYYYSHLASALQFLPYGTLVDHFQHVVYENPEWTIQQRKNAWRELEKQYTPWKNYSGYPNLEGGSFWHMQGHIFASPFYYIDYTLAQVCALQFWVRLQKKDPKAWNDYLAICKVGGTKSFVNVVKLANLISPFEDGCLKEVAETASQYLNNIDDKSL